MIYIVEIPHSGKPYCWAEKDEPRIIRSIMHAYSIPFIAMQFNHWLLLNASHVKQQLVFMSKQEAEAGTKSIFNKSVVNAIERALNSYADDESVPPAPTFERE